MTHMKQGLFLFLAVLIFAGCQRDLGLDGPSGTYLSLNLNLPASADSEGARFIHSDADELTVSLTYPGGNPIVAKFDFNSSSGNTILVEDLEPGTDVLLEVSVGLADSDVILSSASTTLDIVKGVNSPAALTLEALTYTIYGKLYDDADQILASHTFTVDGADVVTDASGFFTLNISTDDIVPDEYVKFQITNGNVFDIARTNLYLMENQADFSLKAHPEILLDFSVKSDQYVLPGAYYEIWQGYVSDGFMVTSGNADAEGHIFYQNTDYSYIGEHELLISYNDTFIDKQPYYSSAPGAVVDDVVMEPYVFTHVSINGGSSYLYRISISGTFSDSIDNVTLESYISDYSTFSIEAPLLLNTVADYEEGKIYLVVAYRDSISEERQSLLVFDGWSDTNPEELALDSVFSYGAYPSSIQQMTVLDDGNLLVASSYGAYLIDTDSLSIEHSWETNDLYAFVCNGVYEDEEGNMMVLAADRKNGTVEDQNSQHIYTLGTSSSTDWTLEEDLPSAYESFVFLGGPLYFYDYIYLKGLYLWDSRIVSIQPHKGFEGSEENGFIVFFTESSGAWDTYGSPIDSESSVNFDYLKPVGVLPDNKFYFVEDTLGSSGRILRLDSPEDTSIESFEFYSDPSSGVQDWYAYFEGGV